MQNYIYIDTHDKTAIFRDLQGQSLTGFRRQLEGARDHRGLTPCRRHPHRRVQRDCRPSNRRPGISLIKLIRFQFIIHRYLVSLNTFRIEESRNLLYRFFKRQQILKGLISYLQKLTHVKSRIDN